MKIPVPGPVSVRVNPVEASPPCVTPPITQWWNLNPLIQTSKSMLPLESPAVSSAVELGSFTDVKVWIVFGSPLRSGSFRVIVTGCPSP